VDLDYLQGRNAAQILEPHKICIQRQEGKLTFIHEFHIVHCEIKLTGQFWIHHVESGSAIQLDHDN